MALESILCDFQAGVVIGKKYRQKFCLYLSDCPDSVLVSLVGLLRNAERLMSGRVREGGKIDKEEASGNITNSETGGRRMRQLL